MAIFASLFALLGRFVGRILTTTLGWASTMLFGQVPQSRQVWLAVLTFGSLVWLALLAGVIVPDVGTILLGFVPLPDWVDQNLVRMAMLVAAILLPAILGGVTLLVSEPEDRPRGRALVGTVLRGYPLTPALAITLAILAVAGTVRRIDSFVHRREDAHVPMIVRPGRYEGLVAAIRRSLEEGRLVTRREPGPKILTAPARMLARIAGGGMERLVPDELAELRGPNLLAAVYPSDLSLSGRKDAVAEARALVARDVDSSNAWFTTTKEAQQLEDRMTALAAQATIDHAALADLDRDLLRITIAQEEWEVLYRRRLQLVDGGELDLGASAPGRTTTGRRAWGGPAPQAPARRGQAPPIVDGSAPPDRTWTPGALVGAATAALVLLDVVLLALGFGRPRPTADRSRGSRGSR